MKRNAQKDIVRCIWYVEREVLIFSFLDCNHNFGVTGQKLITQ